MSARDVISATMDSFSVVPGDAAEYVVRDLTAAGYRILGPDELDRKFKLGDRVTKIKGSSWTGRVVGFYSTNLTPIGYAVESKNEPGSVQIYPETALSPEAPQPEAKEASRGTE